MDQERVREWVCCHCFEGEKGAKEKEESKEAEAVVVVSVDEENWLHLWDS